MNHAGFDIFRMRKLDRGLPLPGEPMKDFVISDQNNFIKYEHKEPGINLTLERIFERKEEYESSKLVIFIESNLFNNKYL